MITLIYYIAHNNLPYREEEAGQSQVDRLLVKLHPEKKLLDVCE